jgi:hypothetical protein
MKTGAKPFLIISQAATGESIPPEIKQTTFPLSEVFIHLTS